jgi:hypothetical protein
MTDATPVINHWQLHTHTVGISHQTRRAITDFEWQSMHHRPHRSGRARIGVFTG